MFTFPNMSRVMCQVSRVTCHVSHVTCHVSHVTSFFYLFIFIFLISFFFPDKVVKLSGGGSVINGAYLVQFRDLYHQYNHFLRKKYFAAAQFIYLSYCKLQTPSAHTSDVFTKYQCTISFKRENINNCIPLTMQFEDVIAESFQYILRDTNDNGYCTMKTI